LKSEYAFPSVLQRMLEKHYPNGRFEVINLAQDNFGIVQVSKVFEDEVLKLSPDVLVLSGWYSDSEVNKNAFNIPNMSDPGAASYVKKLEIAGSLPFVKDLMESKLLKFISSRSEERRITENSPVYRTSPQEY